MLVLSLKILGCSNAGSTASIPAVNNFELGRYLGKWYEIARLPHSFERDMKDVYAEYGLREDGKISVINSGWRDGKKSVANGVAHPKNDPHTGELRVSFFRPFYGDYRIVWLEPDYSAAIVTGATTDYLWILARSPQIEQEQLNRYLEKITKWGFEVSKIEFPWTGKYEGI
jgi:apolipoprotein D and lipocalin family protein